MTFDWNRARAFLVTAEEGSLSAAARALGLAQPTLGRQVEGLEQELGVLLFERVGRGLRLTPAGHELLPHARALGDAANRLSLAAAGQNDRIEGSVSISASDAYAGMILPPILARLHEEEPRISVEIVASNDASDLLRREADIAVRNFRPTEPDLVARKLRDAEARLYAAPAYLSRKGPMQRVEDLNGADFIGIDSSGTMLKALNQMGLSLSEANFPFRSGSYMVMWQMVRQGLGIGILDARIGETEPGVTRICPVFPAIPFPVWLVAHREIHRSRRLRYVFDFLARELR